MASIILSAAGTALGSAVGGPLGSFVGGKIGQLAGGFVERTLLAPKLRIGGSGGRLSDLGVQASTYGRMIPIVYGSVRTAGNVIWARPIKEVATTTTTTSGGGGKGGGKVTQTSTSYSYYASLAIAICEGEVDEVLRIWADAKQVDLSTAGLTIYRGTETQSANSFIQSFEGAANTPAYRGLAYVVFQDFPLADFGNRIPNFTFEVRKRVQVPDFSGQVVEDVIESMVLIPGAGEFVYDPVVENKIPGQQAGAGWVQTGAQVPVNMHNAYGKANVQLALDQLEKACPNVEWVSVVVAWFADSLDIGGCTLKPGVEYQVGATTSPNAWSVAGYTRSTARLITQVGGVPQYGGTPDDGSVLRLCQHLQSRGYKVLLYPMLFVDTSGKPWRGTMTGDAADVAAFFNASGGYNDFITHYATLCASAIDGIIIGSELKGLTAITDTPGSYPAVDEFVDLAADVRAIVGSSKTITYAADWSEYHHTDGGWYNLDPLWACADIDVIGIDAYFPLSDAPQSGYDMQALIDGWTSGEGYDWYYTDEARTTQASLGAAYAWKNLEWFWSHTHTNPDSSTTGWVPNSKKIWFTEIGYPSVDGAANEPNVFYDPTSTQSGFPRFSKGRVDLRAQRIALAAAHAQWPSTSLVERMFVWTWDARPYPYWPDLTSVWADGIAWKTGHWVQGKMGISNLGGIVADLCSRAGLEEADVDASALGDPVEGFILLQQQTLREAIEQLQQAYFFGAAEREGVLSFVPFASQHAVATITEDELAHVGEQVESFNAQRQQELELPKRVNIIYLSRTANYQLATQYAQRQSTSSRENVTVELPVVMGDQMARTIADITLYRHWIGRTRYSFALPIEYVWLEPPDVVEVTVRGVTHRMRIEQVRFGTPGFLAIDAVAEDVSAYDFYIAPADSGVRLQEYQPLPETYAIFMDLPALPGEPGDTPLMRVAAAGLSAGWNGCVVSRSDDGGGNYNALVGIAVPAAIGSAVDALAEGALGVFDVASSVTVSLLGDATLESATDEAVLNGANLALLGDEIIQFGNAELQSPGVYVLSNLLRGRFSTESAVSTHEAGERFVLIDANTQAVAMAAGLLHLPRSYKAVTIGGALADVSAQSFTFHANNLKPFSPVHIAATRDGSDNITLSWVRRTRVGGEWADYADAPLGEESEAYEVEILDGSSVVRTITGLSTASASYTATQQAADFGSAQSSVAVRVYQLSAQVGRGYAGTAVV